MLGQKKYTPSLFRVKPPIPPPLSLLFPLSSIQPWSGSFPGFHPQNPFSSWLLNSYHFLSYFLTSFHHSFSFLISFYKYPSLLTPFPHLPLESFPLLSFKHFHFLSRPILLHLTFSLTYPFFFNSSLSFSIFLSDEHQMNTRWTPDEHEMNTR